MSGLVVLGAGIAGLSAGYHAEKKGYKCGIYETRNTYGGLLDNFLVGGFRFDNAVHLSFTKDEYVRSLFDQTPYITHNPRPYNFEAGRWLKHPVQNNLFVLPDKEKVEAIKSFIERPEICETDNYKEWLVQQYGNYIAERFPVKYTRKYWTVEANQLSNEWVGNRMYRPSIDEVLFGAMTDETPHTYYAQEMRYPKIGGYKGFLNPLLSESTLHTNKKAILIDVEKKYVEFSDGEKVYYEKLVSTIALPQLVKIIKSKPNMIAVAAEQMWSTSVALVSIGFNRPDVAKHLWFYIYDEELQAARVHSPSMKSLGNMPEGCSSLQFEIYFSKHRPLSMDNDNLIEHVIRSLEIMKLADRKDIIVTDCRILPYGNVVFEQGMASKRKMIIDYLKSVDINVAGRFGEWDYLWSDQSLLSGKRVIEKIF